MDLILASTSPYRRKLLTRLGLQFRCIAPQTDETPLPGETAKALAGRLALAKARAVIADHPGALVIGSDQVAELGTAILNKPGDYATAVSQLQASSGKEVCFHTGIALVALDSETCHVEPFTVCFRALREQEITNYLRREQPYDCAGSFKWEELGIALFRYLRGDDPTSLEGLPLISLCRLLADRGVNVLQ